MSEDFILKLVDFVVDWVLGLKNENERSNFFRAKSNGLFLQIIVYVNQLVSLGISNQKLNVVWKNFVDTGIGHFDLEDVSVVPENDMLGDLKGEHCLKLVSFGLELSDFSFQEIDSCIRHLLQVVRIDVFRATLETVQLFLEVF